jgi:acyl-CoA synthetase (AMP-forming)/AMP-acid ligase II
MLFSENQKDVLIGVERRRFLQANTLKEPVSEPQAFGSGSRRDRVGNARQAKERGTMMGASAAADPPTVPGLLRRLVAGQADRTQIQDADGALSFAQVERRSAAMAQGLLASGVGKGEKVGLLLPNGCDWVVAWFAVTRIGAVAVMLSTFAKPRELAHMLRHADVRTLLARDRFLGADFVARLSEALPELEAQSGERGLRLKAAPFLRDIWLSGNDRPRWAKGGYAELPSIAGADAFDGEMLAAVEAEVTPADAALIIYTSGAMSQPKAVVHRHGTVVRHAETMAGYMTYRPGDRCMTTMPFFWVGGLCTSLLAANIRGAGLVCPSTPAPGDCLKAMREQKVTHIALWPAQIAALRALPEFQPEDFARLRPTSAQQLGMFGVVDAALTPNSLGMSETFGPHSMELPQHPLPPDRIGSFGRRVGDIERKVVDPNTGQAAPPGQEGEIWVRGYSLMMGFYKREPADTFERDGFYRTGDIGSISEDDHLFFTGRNTEVIKTSGANVSPREVELLLLADRDVLDAAVVGLPHARLGEMVVAAVVPRPDAVIDEATLRVRLREQLADYKVPKRIILLDNDDMPRTDSAKVRKPQLALMLAERLRAEDAADQSPLSA